MSNKPIRRVFGWFQPSNRLDGPRGLPPSSKRVSVEYWLNIEDQDKRYLTALLRGVYKREKRYRENDIGHPIYRPLVRGLSNSAFLQEEL